LAKLVKQAGLGGARFHGCRQTCASLMLPRKISPKIVTEMLGHTSASFTMDVYHHVVDGMQEDAMALLDAVMPEGVAQRNDANLTPTFCN